MLRKYSGTYYHTKFGALCALRLWQLWRYTVIFFRGDKVLKDNSFIHLKFVWTKPKPFNPKDPTGLHEISQTKILKWFIFKGIWTKGLVEDIQKMSFIDVEKEFENEMKKYINDKKNKNEKRN